jgi:hypothetical protein
MNNRCSKQTYLSMTLSTVGVSNLCSQGTMLQRILHKVPHLSVSMMTSILRMVIRWIDRMHPEEWPKEREMQLMKLYRLKFRQLLRQTKRE